MPSRKRVQGGELFRPSSEDPAGARGPVQPEQRQPPAEWRQGPGALTYRGDPPSRPRGCLAPSSSEKYFSFRHPLVEGQKGGLHFRGRKNGN